MSINTSSDFRKHASECLRWADQTTDPEQAATLYSIARDWMLAALIADMQAIAFNGAQ